LCPECYKPVGEKQNKKRMLGSIGKVFKKIPVDLDK